MISTFFLVEAGGPAMSPEKRLALDEFLNRYTRPSENREQARERWLAKT